ncbi:hypothetical protein F4V91_04385 [Neorhizobium galegae]|uniref:Uncharacterized protein n=1 Tax=Neorhizobium galegae TaxID=399 RepID=A0A6A1TNF2_NEOGA|nr:hypothetical protein [Neorhizobium galegae]KAB1085740.1 hypothetical protein F4V91_04385 [Neorhizobium galegae]
MALTGPFGFSANLPKMRNICICSAFVANLNRILAIDVKHNCGSSPEPLGFLGRALAKKVNVLGKIEANPSLTLR